MRRPIDKFREDNLKLRLALRAAPIGIWDWNLETNEMNYSPRARAISGFSPDEPITLEKVRAVTHPEDLPRTWKLAGMALDPAIRNTDPYEYRIVRADTGEVRWALAHGEAVFQRVSDTVKAVRFLGTIQDITGRKLAENALREAELRQRLAIDAARMAVWELDVPTDRLNVSPELNRMFGLAADSCPSVAELRMLLAPGDLERIMEIRAEAAMGTDPHFEAEFRCRFPDGSLRWRLLRAEIKTSPTGEPKRIIGVLMDIDERKRADEQKHLLLREVHHRVKNSLAVIQALATQTFGRGAADPDALKSFLGRLAALAKATDLTVAQQGQPFGLMELIGSVTEPFWSPNRFELQGDAVRLPARLNVPLALVLNELCSNAAKFGALSNPNGTVGIRWEITPTGLELHWRERGGPPVPPRLEHGFGLRLILDVLPVEFGSAQIDPRPSGISCRIVVANPD
ncbi:PAS domain-containing protein [Mesorhizobium sp. ESP7-2]|uniref:sensor histidine kinase n=1 Tax=unclassified Mesorhizobium TaxID=325217 RepID=UPI001CCCBC41|nr:MULTISPECIES: PAS domain-containing protein [unclassified Mesorhizobium]MBZ9673106.1 PAS domain-containing protein [Mesorhizobium sp. ES1-3]MBZ9709445.1 PAS domain-containing protein [Mesorhizobium sp. ESP7-2]